MMMSTFRDCETHQCVLASSSSKRVPTLLVEKVRLGSVNKSVPYHRFFAIFSARTLKIGEESDTRTATLAQLGDAGMCKGTPNMAAVHDRSELRNGERA
ncbi:hypothetical protein J6590_086256 [Homalodisca vitripennis]|nr:hypothetical protein J6590_086256 [Homalodisca vitripennis]